ncbi:MFS transporter [Actinosynnema sp. NPDC047251]|uniref:Permease, MFS-type n=1 Tax=Saccharothrix espanaensis (strain ATCC 51144 / DSM 44229 / JCM 9112 / NBRC 15066 / NRRL 15764) TaxID=1179773 RepID=K0JSB2_SACES|nr:MFS transporter [Saccharothrix espanaensis]CCH30560.1 Permease, MFS-type [Saccharothrix espanaensis DSM 44229]
MTVSLARNRNYTLLWGGQAVAEVGFSATMIAFPLLVLAITGSPVASGLVLTVDATAQLLAGVPAGVLVDRMDRRRIMLACEAAQAVALASLVIALIVGEPSFLHMAAVAAVLGVARALFEPAEDACLPRLVPEEQLATAVAMNAARSSLGQTVGTTLGGVLFAFTRWLPFLLDLITHCLAFVALAFLRVPPREPVVNRQHFVREMGDGLRWVWQRREVRVTALCAVVLNLFFTAFYLVVIVLAEARGVSSAMIGVMAAMLGVGGVVGALIAPWLHRALGPFISIASVFWALTLLTPIAYFVSDGIVMGGLFALMTLLAPTANTTISTHQLLLTPDELRGRMSGVLSVVVGAAGALGPLVGGTLTEAFSADRAVLVCAVGIAVITAFVTVSPTLRRYSARKVDQEGVPDEV